MKFYNRILMLVKSRMLEELGAAPEDLNNVKLMFVWEHEHCSETDIVTLKDIERSEQMADSVWITQFWKRHGRYPNFVTIYGIRVGDKTYEIDIQEGDSTPITTEFKDGSIIRTADDKNRIVEKYWE